MIAGIGIGIAVARHPGATGAEELANYEAKNGRLSRDGQAYWVTRPEYSRLSLRALQAWTERAAAAEAAEATPFDDTVVAYLDALTPEARERKLHRWSAKVDRR